MNSRNKFIDTVFKSNLRGWLNSARLVQRRPSFSGQRLHSAQVGDSLWCITEPRRLTFSRIPQCSVCSYRVVRQACYFSMVFLLTVHLCMFKQCSVCCQTPAAGIICPRLVFEQSPWGAGYLVWQCHRQGRGPVSPWEKLHCLNTVYIIPAMKS
jgi:hypothetical protein